MKTRNLAIGCALLATTSCTTLHPQPRSDASEWLPTITLPTTCEDWEQQEILTRCGLSNAKQIWIRTLDLDRDGKEDCVVTVALPEERGPRWTNYRSLTYVFRGGGVGAFGRRWSEAKLWFSLVTFEGQDHVVYGDSERIRQFSLFRRGSEWYLSLREHEYGNAGGEAKDRFRQFRNSNSWTESVATMLPASPRYP